MRFFKNTVDWFLLAVALLAIGQLLGLFNFLSIDVTPSLNAGLCLLIMGVFLKKYGPPKSIVALLILLLFFALRILKVPITADAVGLKVVTYSVTVAFLTIDPVFTVFLITFVILNFRFFRRVSGNLIYGSTTDQAKALDKKVVFYYDKFKICSSEELERAYNMYNDYPFEARLALDQIKKEQEGLIIK